MKQEERDELKTLRSDNVRMMLAANSRGTGRGASVSGFKIHGGEMNRGDVMDWLVEQATIEAAQKAATLRWAMIGGVAGILAIIVTVVLALLKK